MGTMIGRGHRRTDDLTIDRAIACGAFDDLLVQDVEHGARLVALHDLFPTPHSATTQPEQIYRRA